MLHLARGGAAASGDRMMTVSYSRWVGEWPDATTDAVSRWAVMFWTGENAPPSPPVPGSAAVAGRRTYREEVWWYGTYLDVESSQVQPEATAQSSE